MNSTTSLDSIRVTNSPTKLPNNKHIIPADSISVNKQLGTGEFGIVQQGVWTNGNERVKKGLQFYNTICVILFSIYRFKLQLNASVGSACSRIPWSF